MSGREKQDHAAEARGLLVATEDDLATGSSNSTVGIQLANAYASLAIAEQLERLNDQLADVIDPTVRVTGASASFPGCVRIRLDQPDA